MTKRLRSEDLEHLDDSMQSLVSEFKAKPNRNVEDLCNFMADYVEKSEDYRRKFYAMCHQHQALEKRVDEIVTRLETNDVKQKENDDQIELVEREVKEIKDTTKENESSLHRLEQKQIDTHIFVSGFPTKPDEDEVLESILNLFDIPKESIDFKYSFSFESKPRKPNAASSPQSSQAVRSVINYQMVVAFKDHRTKSKLMKQRQIKGPLMYEQLTKAKLNPEDAKSTIRCVNRLSKFNLKVQRELLTAKADQRIHSFQLHNGVFRLKEEENSGWKIIDTESALKPFNAPRQKK